MALFICRYCGFGNPVDSGCCEKCGAPNREAFRDAINISTRNISAVALNANAYLIGCDISHWDGKIDWATVKPNISFAILKCTEGTTFVDDTYAFNKAGCEINNIPHGV